MKNFIRLLSLFIVTLLLFTACEGPMGPAGADGNDGTDGKDANETCKLCHNSEVVEATANQFKYSTHYLGEAFEEGTRNNCAPCHSNQGFLYVTKNNTPATIVANPSDPTKFINNYVIPASATSFPGEISCFTCHSSLHTNYAGTEFLPLTTTAAVPMTMWGGSKSINFAKTTGNLCAKCHQPRPVTASSGALIDYSKLVSDPTAKFTLASVSYRTGIHYGAQGAMASGTGGIEFGTGYSNSAHTSGASCITCHMAAASGFSGGHSFIVSGNFNGCNAASCHSTMSSSSDIFTTTQTVISGLLDQLAEKINATGAGHDILQKDPVTNKYNGYLDIYDSGSNATGYWKNPANGTPAFPAITNAQFGAIINYQLVVRDGSLGVHNFPYIKRLLENTIAAI